MELKTVIEQVSREKGLKKEIVAKAVTEALAKVLSKKYPYGRIEVSVNEESGEMEAYHFKTVVDSEPEMLDEESEVNLPEAKKLDPDCEVGDELGFVISADLGRIDANISKQIIMAAIYRAESEIAYQQFLPFKGKVLSGIVQRVEVGGTLISLGKIDAFIPKEEMVRTETLSRGMSIDCYVKDVIMDDGRCKVFLSRKTPKLVEELFKEEVPELEDGTVEIKGCYREAGTKTKLLVDTKERMNPVAVCIGTQGYRIQKVQHRLGGERVDIIQYSVSPLNLLPGLLNNVRIYNVQTSDSEISCEVEKDQMAKAIGPKGSNVRLAGEILGKKVVVKEKGSGVVSSSSEKIDETAQG